MFTITEDTTKGVHDTLISACDSARYLELMGEEGRGHRSCADNLIEGLEALGWSIPILSFPNVLEFLPQFGAFEYR